MTDLRRIQEASEQREAATANARLFFRALFPEIDWDTEHTMGTAERFVNMMLELTTKPDIKWKDFESTSDEMVVVKDINFHSLCAHHMVPYMGVAHVGYIPNGRVCGLSKLARVVRHCAAGLTIQEDLTTEIADMIDYGFCGSPDGLVIDAKHQPRGVAVVMEAEHMCMTLRGVRAAGAKTTTSCMRGAFADHDRLARQEFLNFIGRGSA